MWRLLPMTLGKRVHGLADGEFWQMQMTKHCSICTAGHVVKAFLSHCSPNPCIIPSHHITDKSLSLWRVRQFFTWEDVGWYWITALFPHMHAFFMVNLSFLCLREEKFKHLSLENSSLLPRQLAELEMHQIIPQRQNEGWGLCFTRGCSTTFYSLKYWPDARCSNCCEATSQWARSPDQVYLYPSFLPKPHIQRFLLTFPKF